MATILCIETSTSVCSVSLTQDGVAIINEINYNERSHATSLSPMIQRILDRTVEMGIMIDAVAVSCGPGSYTGLRIGVSTAKGVCYGKDLPLIAINTLKLIGYTVRAQTKQNNEALYCPMIDARRMEVYTCLFDQDLSLVQDISAKIIEEDSFSDVLADRKVIFAGDGAEKCMSVLEHDNALYMPDIIPLAQNMAVLAEKSFVEKVFEDVAYFEPFYLKDFVATTPRKKVL